MKAIKSLSGLSFVAIMSMVIASIFSFNPLATFGVMFTLALVAPMPKGVAAMAITKEIWTKDIVNNLFKDNQFALNAFNADIYVLLGKVVHIAVAGAGATIKKNLNIFPQAAVKRADTEITYALDTFYSLPRHIEKIEQYELEYDKRQSVLGEDQASLVQSAMDNLLYKWAAPAANTIATEGAAVPATLTGATGNRKAFTKAAFQKIKLKMDKANIPQVGRVALLTADHFNQFFESLSDAEKTNVGRVADLAKGVVGEYLGFKIMQRSSVLRYRGATIGVNTVAVDEQDEAFAANVADRAASLFWEANSVERAKGSIEIFDNPNQAGYYGDVFSMNMRLGGRIRRAEGVYAVVEEASA